MYPYAYIFHIYLFLRTCGYVNTEYVKITISVSWLFRESLRFPKFLHLYKAQNNWLKCTVCPILTGMVPCMSHHDINILHVTNALAISVTIIMYLCMCMSSCQCYYINHSFTVSYIWSLDMLLPCHSMHWYTIPSLTYNSYSVCTCVCVRVYT